MYNAKVLDHFQNPRNNAEMEAPDAIGIGANPVCGDSIRLFLRIRNGIVEQATFKTMGCGGAIACGSILTEIVRGKAIEELRTWTVHRIASEIGELPNIKMHCPELAFDALVAALDDCE